jgi:hypothetical protein
MQCMVLVRAILNGFFMFPPNLEVVGGSGYVDFDRYHLLWECGEKFFCGVSVGIYLCNA